MSKRLLLLSFIFLSAIVYVSAQTKSNLNIVVSPQLNENFSVRAGVDVDIQFNKRWSFVPGAYWSLRSRSEWSTTTYSDGSTKKVNIKDNSHYISIPLRAGVRITSINKNNFALQALFGPYFAYGIDGTRKCTINRDGVIESQKVNVFGDNGNIDGRFDYGLNAGLNAIIKGHFIVGVFSEFGFRSIYKSDDILEDIFDKLFHINNNYAFGITLGCRF